MIVTMVAIARQAGRAGGAAGWTVLRFTWADMAHQPADLVRAVAGALGRDFAA